MAKNKTNFPEIGREYDYYTIKIENRKIKLLYGIREYKIVRDKNKTKTLKKHGVRLKLYKKMNNNGKVETAYYRLYSTKVVSLKQKQRTINKILKMEIGEDNSRVELGRHIENTWNGKTTNRTTSDNLMDRETCLLDALSSYYIGGLEGDDILSQDMTKKLQKKEYYCNVSIEDNYSNKVEKDKKVWQIRTMDKNTYKKAMKKPCKRWKKSKTYKLDNLFSFNDHKDKKLVWNWIEEKWVGVDLDYHFNIKRIIDPEQPYSADWCYVDTDNIFTLNGEKYKIDEEVKQYKTEPFEKNNKCKMDNILIIKQGDLLMHFDQNINWIENEKIQRLPSTLANKGAL